MKLNEVKTEVKKLVVQTFGVRAESSKTSFAKNTFQFYTEKEANALVKLLNSAVNVNARSFMAKFEYAVVTDNKNGRIVTEAEFNQLKKVYGKDLVVLDDNYSAG